MPRGTYNYYFYGNFSIINPVLAVLLLAVPFSTAGRHPVAASAGCATWDYVAHCLTAVIVGPSVSNRSGSADQSQSEAVQCTTSPAKPSPQPTAHSLGVNRSPARHHVETMTASLSLVPSYFTVPFVRSLNQIKLIFPWTPTQPSLLHLINDQDTTRETLATRTYIQEFESTS